MQGENTTRRGQLKGYMFEVVIRRLLHLNNFEIITHEVRNRVRIQSNHSIEIKGRGTWHQIDCPCIYNKSSPFIYDLRLLAELKFHQKEIQKEKVREFMGVIKDISENYFIEENYTIQNQKRYTDIGVFFAANGFQLEAEKLAFVHGIKTISYKNNGLMENIKNTIIDLERNHLKTENCISSGNRNRFMDDLLELLENPDNTNIFAQFKETYSIENGDEVLINLIHYSNDIKTSFFGTTSTNYFLHFISEHTFPSHLFRVVDERNCQVYYTQNGYFYLIIEGDNYENRFYFTPPNPLLDLAFSRQPKIEIQRRMVNEKITHFERITVSITLEGVQRTIVLKLNQRWLRRFVDE